jgi:coenzyme PQQ biosynthesis protein PqqD
VIATGSRPRLAAKARLRWDAKEERWFLLYPERGLALNPSGSAVLELCDGARTVAEIVDALAVRAASAPRVDIERDVLAFLDELAGRGLVIADA